MRIELTGWQQASRLKKGVVICVWTLGMVSLLYAGYLYLDYGARMPSSPDARTERVNRFDFKGRTVYITKDEESRYRSVYLISELSFGAFAVAVLTWGRPWESRGG